MTVKKKIIWAILVFVCCIFACGIWYYCKRSSFSEGEIPVLMYHNVLPSPVSSVWVVSTEEFERQMDELCEKGYETILPEQLYRHQKGYGFLPKKPIIITFDDGYEGVAKYAEPILKKRKMKAICYAIVNRLGKEGDEERPVFDSGPLMMCKEAAEMNKRGTISVGIHSLKHQRNPKQHAIEIYGSRRRLRELTGIKTRSYCYPFGQVNDEILAAVKKEHIHTAPICQDKIFVYTRTVDLLTIPRLSVYGGTHNIRIEMTSQDCIAISNVDGNPLPLRVNAILEDGTTADLGLFRVGNPSINIAIPKNTTKVILTDKENIFTYANYDIMQ